MKNGFSIPLQTDVEKYIKEKKNWPEKFVSYYANRFWNNYQASGWKLSNGNAMKDWKAAFNSQWQTLKFKEDIDYLTKCMAASPQHSDNRAQDYLNDCLNDYKKHWDTIPLERYVAIYDYLKEKRAVKMTEEEKKSAKEFCNGSVDKGKQLCIKIIFDRMIMNNQKF